MKRNTTIWTATIALITFTSSWADEMGSGRAGDDTPDASPPADPVQADISDDFLQPLLEWFTVDVEQQKESI